MSGEAIHLCLADGTRFAGHAVGANGTTVGECVFTTAMTGYQEVLSDPSYHGQIVCMTAPQIGNTGCNDMDSESVDGTPKLAGLVVRDLQDVPSSWRAERSLNQELSSHDVVAISGVNTRKLTRHLRDNGVQNAAIGPGDPQALVRKAQAAPSMTGLDLVQHVTPDQPYTFSESNGLWRAVGQHSTTQHSTTHHSRTEHSTTRPGRTEQQRHVVVIDLGVKRNILRCLVDVGCHLSVVPAGFSANDILALKPDGIFVSNGPGDPSAVTNTIDTIRGLLGKRPLFGICLGHQIIALSAGAKTHKLKFGHRGINQPVKDLHTGQVQITTQNHGFVVNMDLLAGRARCTHIHLNDQTCEGIELHEIDAFGVQYHPEAAAGPHDAISLFERFVERIDRTNIVL